MNIPEQLKRHTENFIGGEDLAERLAAGKKLRVKLGVDPTRPDLTFGHMVVFNKLRQFQDEGHEAILIIGDFTTLIGDPSGRSSTRPVLGKEEIDANAATYLEQAFRVLDKEKTTVYRNSDWFSKMGFEDALHLARKMTVARMLERDDFSKRYAANSPISIVEFLYPLLQGYDSVKIEADVELGGTDQLFNLLVGRQLQKEAGQPMQAVVTMPLLVGLDGVHKMSKSLDNYIAFNDAPKDMFGKIMSVSDDLMWSYYSWLLNTPDEEVAQLKAGHPMDAKKQLALRLTATLYDPETAQRELEQFERVFSQNMLPDDMPTKTWDELADGDTATLAKLLGGSGLFSSNKEARRMIQEGGVKLNGEKTADPTQEIQRPTEDIILQAGKRKFVKITP